MRAILKDLKPNCFEDIIAVLALYRPGPMEQIPEFVRRKHGGTISYLHPKMEEILQTTYGIIVYQEQVMQIARNLAGYSLGRADLLRRAMGKKDRKIMEEERQNFIGGLQDQNGEWVVPGAVRLGVKEKEADEIFELIAKFAEYGFNKGHATAYAMISYQTAYLKANYPLEFTASLLSSVIGSSDKVSFYIQEARAAGIEILPPDVQHSYKDFTIEDRSIRFGLEAIRNVGGQLVDKIILEREKGPIQSFYDFILRMDSKIMNKRTLESLIKAGAFQSLCNRAQAMRAVDQALELAQNRQKDMESGQISLFDLDDKLDNEFQMPVLDEFEENEILKMEKEYIGIYLSSHPLNAVTELLRRTTSSDIATCLESGDEKKVILGGIINAFRQTITKKGEMMASFVLEDLSGTIEVLVFPRLFAEVGNLDNDRIVIVQGRYYVNEDEKKIFAEKITPIENHLTERQTSAVSEKRAEDPNTKKLSRLFLKIESNDQKELIENIRNLLGSYHGNHPVYFFFQDTQKVFELSKSLCIRKSPELEDKLIQLIGAENIRWQ
jgi:DNA polymerase-3 subunit alpha